MLFSFFLIFGKCTKSTSTQFKIISQAELSTNESRLVIHEYRKVFLNISWELRQQFHDMWLMKNILIYIHLHEAAYIKRIMSPEIYGHSSEYSDRFEVTVKLVKPAAKAT